MAELYARVAVSDITYWVDKPYDYLVPSALREVLRAGMRVSVPFSRGNRKAEGIVLGLSHESACAAAAKPVLAVLDETPVLTEAQLRLALWMRERFFCTVYEAVKAMLPAGLWYRPDGTRRTQDRQTEWIRLRVLPEEAIELAEQKRMSRARQQAAVLRLLSAVGEASVADLRAMTGAGRQSLNALCSAAVVEYFYRECFRRPAYRQGPARALPELQEEQQRAFESLAALQRKGSAGGALLQGVTGSGKTVVYIRLIDAVLRQGRGVILLVPEIALTPQMLETFSSYFGDTIAVLHSSLSVAERYDEWKRVRAGAARLVIGTRSAVFAPVEDLGLVIIDEEQEDTYKSDSAPRYHAKDVAKYRCAQSNALLLLGSATPDVRSRYEAESGRYAFVELRTRYNRKALPAVQIVDMKRELRAGNGGSISSLLRQELRRNLDAGEQSILFLNRRGTARLITCVDCGFTFHCPNCSVNLTWHAGSGKMLCHVCGWSQKVSAACPDCGGRLRFTGDGTEKIESLLGELFPGAGVLRVDTDTVQAARGHDALFQRFQEERIPIMIGTQMVSKGLNFGNVTLVGVLLADQSLYAGDYRAGERTFSLLTQVIGRGGRAEKPGRAVIQTFTPENQVIRYAARQDYDAFYQGEIELRRLQKSPPFRQLIALTVTGIDEYRVLDCCRQIRSLLLRALEGFPGTDVLGPAPYPIVRVMNRFRYRLTLRSQPGSRVRGLIGKLLVYCNTDRAYRGVSVYADMDPLE